MSKEEPKRDELLKEIKTIRKLFAIFLELYYETIEPEMSDTSYGLMYRATFKEMIED